MITRAAGFFYRVYLSRLIGAEGIGVYQIALSIFTVLVTITSSGIPVTVSRKSAQFYAVKNYKAIDSTVTSAAIFTLIISSAFSILILIFDDLFAYLFTDSRCMPIFLMLLPAFVASSVYSAFRGGLWGQKAYVSYSVVELVEELALIIAGVLLTLGVDSVSKKTMSAAAAVSISYSVAAVLTVILYLKRGGKFAKSGGYLKPLIKSSVPITSVKLVSSILSSVIALVFPIMLTLNGLTKAQALAEYGIITGMTFPLLYLPSAFVGSLALVLVPEISQDIALKNNKEVKARIDSALNFALAVALIIIPAFVACGKELGMFLFKNEKAGTYLQYFCYMMAPMCLSMISTSICNSMGKEFTALKNYFIGAALLILSITILPKFLGVYSLMVGHILSLTVSTILNILSIRKSAAISFKFLKNGLILGIANVPVIFLGNNIQSICNFLKLPLISSGFTMAICVGFVFIIAVIFGVLDIKVLFTKRKKKKIIKAAL